jgi:hypothetical protein
LQDYEDQSQPIGKLLNAESGQKFFDVLRDKAHGAELKRAQADLGEFGLPDNYFKQLADSHAKLHDYVKTAQRTSISKIKAIVEHPVVGTLGFAAGHTALPVSPWLGGILGGVGAAALADRVAAARAIAKLGGAPEIIGRFGRAADVRPFEPEGEVPEPQQGGARPPAGPPDPRVQTVQDVAAALRDQYPKLTKAEALNQAQAAVGVAGPDFDAAFRQAMRGRTEAVSGGSQTASSQTELASRVRGAQQITLGPGAEGLAGTTRTIKSLGKPIGKFNYSVSGDTVTINDISGP